MSSPDPLLTSQYLRPISRLSKEKAEIKQPKTEWPTNGGKQLPAEDRVDAMPCFLFLLKHAAVIGAL